MAKQTIKYKKTTKTRVKKTSSSAQYKTCPTCKGTGKVKT